jgi:hypothetical protein
MYLLIYFRYECNGLYVILMFGVCWICFVNVCILIWFMFLGNNLVVCKRGLNVVVKKIGEKVI